MIKFLTLFWILFLPSTLYLFLDSFYSQHTIDLTKNWLKLDSEHIGASHMASSLAHYQRLIISSDFIKGVKIYDSSLKVVSYFGELTETIPPVFREKNGIQFNRTGFFKYRTTFVVNTFDQQYLVIFFFDSKVGKISFLIVAFTLIFLSICFVVISLKRNSREIDKRLATVVRAIESYAHDIGNTLNWTRKLVQAVNEGDKNKSEELSRYVDRTLRFANGLRLEILSLSNPVLKDVKTIELKETYFQCRDILVSDISKIKIIENFKHTLQLQADEIKISRIIINLLQNAYRHARTFISINTRNHENGIVFEMTNDGANIPKSIIKDVFKPFVSTNGSGLGLYICKVFVELHGGNIEISSLHEITKLKIWFPGVSSKNIKTALKFKEKQNLIIALIDDESYHLEEISEKFLGSGIHLVMFSNIDDFFSRLLENEHFDAVIVDRFGPGFDSVVDEFPRVAREDFAFQGKIVLYSNSVLHGEENCQFDFSLSKEVTLTPKILLDILDYKNPI